MYHPLEGDRCSPGIISCPGAVPGREEEEARAGGKVGVAAVVTG